MKPLNLIIIAFPYLTWQHVKNGNAMRRTVLIIAPTYIFKQDFTLYSQPSTTYPPSSVSHLRTYPSRPHMRGPNAPYAGGRG